jgi:hypothetical protein
MQYSTEHTRIHKRTYTADPVSYNTQNERDTTVTHRLRCYVLRASRCFVVLVVLGP